MDYSNNIDSVAVATRSLDALALRMRLTANNVANVDTPNFKASEVQFESVLRQALGSSPGTLVAMRTHQQHLLNGSSTAGMEPKIVEASGTSLRNDGNNVDIEREMATLAETTLQFNALTEALSRRLAMQRMIATDGR